MNEFVTVYSAEVMRRLRSRVFWIGLLLGAIGLAIIIEVPSMMERYANQANRVVIAAQPSLAARARALLAKNLTVVGTMPYTTAVTRASLRRNGDAGAVIALRRAGNHLQADVFDRNPGELGATELRRDLLPLNIELGLHVSPSVVASVTAMPVAIHSLAAKFGSAQEADTARITGVVLLSFLYALIMFNSQMILSAVAEEKTSRIAELLVASVSPNRLLAGKIGAAATLAIIQMAVWIAVGFAIGSPHAGSAAALQSRGSDQLSLTGVSAQAIAGFAVFFLLGYLQMATLFAAAGSLINRTEDLGSVSGPLFLPVIGGFFIAMAVLSVPDTPVAVATSFIPLISPFVMFARIVVSDVPPYQIALGLLLNIAAVAATALIAGKIYRIGMLLYGRPPRLRQIWQVLRG